MLGWLGVTVPAEGQGEDQHLSFFGRCCLRQWLLGVLIVSEANEDLFLSFTPERAFSPELSD